MTHSLCPCPASWTRCRAATPSSPPTLISIAVAMSAAARDQVREPGFRKTGVGSVFHLVFFHFAFGFLLFVRLFFTSGRGPPFHAGNMFAVETTSSFSDVRERVCGQNKTALSTSLLSKLAEVVAPMSMWRLPAIGVKNERNVGNIISAFVPSPYLIERTNTLYEHLLLFKKKKTFSPLNTRP